MTASHLTEDEREELALACDAGFGFGDAWVRGIRSGVEDMLLPVVERILAARTATPVGAGCEDPDAEATTRAPSPEVAPDGLRAGTLGDAERCNRCGGENVTWFAPSPLWNYVMRGNDINGEARYRDLVCVPCFIVLAGEAGVPDSRWCVYADPEPEGLIKVTPTGRVWDAERGMWGEPNPAHTAEATTRAPSIGTEPYRGKG